MNDQTTTKAKGKAPVDGKRLAQLEGQVSELTLALSANGIDLIHDQDPVQQAITVIKRWRELTGARAELQLAVAIAVNVEPDTIEDPHAAAIGALETMGLRIQALEMVDKVDPALELMRKRLFELEEENKELKIDVEELASAKNALTNKLAGAREGEPEPPVVEQEKPAIPLDEKLITRPGSARDVGPEYGTLSMVEIKAAADAGATFELAFSNGTFEIIEYSTPRIELTGPQLTRVEDGKMMVKPPVHIKGAGPEVLHGVGLLLEDVQVGYCRFEPAIPISAGDERKFDRVIIFS